MLQICRLCLSPSYSLEHIFTYEGENGTISLQECISSFFSIQIRVHDSLPEGICDKCIQIISKINKYRIEFLKNDEVLRKQYIVKQDEMQNNIHKIISTAPLLNSFDIKPSSESDDEYTPASSLHSWKQINCAFKKNFKCTKKGKKKRKFRSNHFRSEQSLLAVEEYSLDDGLATLYKAAVTTALQDEADSATSSSTCISYDSEGDVKVTFQSCKIPSKLVQYNLEPRVLVNKLDESEVDKLCDLYKVSKTSENNIKLLVQFYEEDYITSTFNTGINRVDSVYFNSQWDDFEKTLYGKKTDVDSPTPERLLLSEGQHRNVLECNICNKIYHSKKQLKSHLREHKKKLYTKKN